MKPIAACGLLLLCLAHTGCSLCCTPWDYAYPGYGGLTPREDRFDGRVGSIFAPAGPIPGVSHPRDYLPPPPASEQEPAEQEPAEQAPAENMEENTPNEGDPGANRTP